MHFRPLFWMIQEELKCTETITNYNLICASQDQTKGLPGKSRFQVATTDFRAKIVNV